MLTYFIFWFPMLLIAILNGVLREGWIKQRKSASSAHQLSTFSLLFFFILFMAMVFRYFPLETANQAIQLGIMWMMMTLIFEFGFGRWRGKSWTELVSDYNVFKGRLWILIPLWLCVGPYIFYRIY